MSAGAQPRRVAVTGLGAFSPGGAGVAACADWQATVHTDGPLRVPHFNPEHYIRNPRRLRTMHRSFQLATAAAVMAMEAAGLGAEGGFPHERAGVASALADVSPVTADLLRVLAAAAPGLGRVPDGWASFAELGARELHPFRRLALLANMAAAHTSLLLNLQGPSFTFTSGAAAGLQTVIESYWTVAAGRADLMIAQSACSPQQAYTSVEEAELAAAVVMEDWDTAARRGAPVIAELVPGAGRMPPGAPGLAPAPELLRVVLRLAAGGRRSLPELAWEAGAEMRERRA